MNRVTRANARQSSRRAQGHNETVLDDSRVDQGHWDNSDASGRRRQNRRIPSRPEEVSHATRELLHD